MHRVNSINLVNLVEESDGYGRVIFCGCPGLLIRSDGGVELSDGLLNKFVDVLSELRTSIFLSLIDQEELPEIRLADIRRSIQNSGIEFVERHLPDFTIPDSEFERFWFPLEKKMVVELKAGKSVAIQCLAGCGRSSLLASCLLTRFGISAAQAIAALRKEEPEAVETEAQFRYIEAYEKRHRDN